MQNLFLLRRRALLLNLKLGPSGPNCFLREVQLGCVFNIGFFKIMSNTSSVVDSSRHPVFDSFISPLKFMEAKVWLERPANQKVAKELRGLQGETVLHWASMSEMGLLMDTIYNVELDVNVTDSQGMTPMDWLLERIKMADEQLDLTNNNRLKLQLQTDDLATILWGMGGRPTGEIKQYIHILAKNGLWRLLQSIEESEGVEVFLDVNEQGNNILYYTIIAPNTAPKLIFLKEWSKQWLEEQKITKPDADRLNINSPDRQGRNLIWWVVDELLKPNKHEEKKHFSDLSVLLEALIVNGADINHPDKDGISASSLVLHNETAPLSTKEYLTLIMNPGE